MTAIQIDENIWEVNGFNVVVRPGEGAAEALAYYEAATAGPTDAEVLDDYKRSRLVMIDDERDRRLTQPLVAGRYTFDGDERSQRNVTDAAIAARLAVLSGHDWSGQWITADDQIVTVTANDLEAAANAFGARRAALYLAARIAKTAVEAAETIEAAEQIQPRWP